MNWNPLRRKPIKPKPRRHKESMPWRRPKVRLNGSEMAKLRQDAFERSGGQCENSIEGQRCTRRITWLNSNLAHIESRGRGGSDTLWNVLMTCLDCHENDTLHKRNLHPHRDWIPIA